MVPRGTITVTTILLCIILGLLSPAPALGSHFRRACCTRYNRKPVPFHRIKGYREQTIIENCRIEAIIFYTVKKYEICVTREDEWVRKILELLSSKLKNMSKTAAAAEAPMKTNQNLPINDGSGSFLSTTETFPNTTKHSY